MTTVVETSKKQPTMAVARTIAEVAWYGADQDANEEASDKVLEVEQFYNDIRRPVYGKRNDIIHSIQDFWLTAFLSHPVLCELVTDEDQKVFKYLESLDI